MSELYFRVVFRGWECSHSIRSEMLLRYWCPDFSKKIDRSKKVGKTWKTKNRKLKKSGHQYRSKISLRIEWEHSQPLKITLKYSSGHQSLLLFMIEPGGLVLRKYCISDAVVPHTSSDLGRYRSLHNLRTSTCKTFWHSLFTDTWPTWLFIYFPNQVRSSISESIGKFSAMMLFVMHKKNFN